MTLDEQIAYLQGVACGDLSMAARIRRGDVAHHAYSVEWEQECREEAAMLLTIENTLRAMRNPDPAIGASRGWRANCDA